jgi:hypothetical protein
MQVINNDQVADIEQPQTNQQTIPVKQTPVQTTQTGGDDKKPGQNKRVDTSNGFKQLVHDALDAAGFDTSDENVERVYNQYNNNKTGFIDDLSKEIGVKLPGDRYAKLYQKYLNGTEHSPVKAKPTVPKLNLKTPAVPNTPQYNAANAQLQKDYSSLDPDTKQKWDQAAQLETSKQPDEISEVTPEQRNAIAWHNSAAGKVSDFLHLPALNQAFYKPLAGATDVIDDAMGKVYSTVTGKPYKSQKGGFFDEQLKDSELKNQTRPNQGTLLDGVGEGVSSSVPILLTSLATDGGSLAPGLSESTPLISHFAKLNAANAFLGDYHTSHENGLSGMDLLNHASGAGMEGGVEGMYMDALGMIGGAYGKGVMERIGKVLPKTAENSKNLIHALSTSLTFGTDQAVKNAINGDPIDSNVGVQAGVGAAFGAHDVINEGKDNLGGAFTKWKLNSDIAKTNLQNLAQQRVKALFTTPIEGIQHILDLPGTSADYQVKSLETGISAVKADDVKQKASGQVAQASLQHVANIKAAAENIEKDPESVKQIITDSNVPDQQKQAAIEKIDQIAEIQKAAKSKSKASKKASVANAAPSVNEPSIGDHVVDNNGVSHEIIGYGQNGGYLNEFGNEVSKDNIQSIVKGGQVTPANEPATEPQPDAENLITKVKKAAQPAGTEHITNPLNDRLMELGYNDNDFAKLNDEQKHYIIDNKVQKPTVETPEELHKKRVAEIFNTIGIENPEHHAENAIVQKTEPFMNHEQTQISEQENNNIDEKSSDAEGQVIDQAGRQDGQEVGDQGREQERPEIGQKDDEAISVEERQGAGKESGQEEVGSTTSGVKEKPAPENVRLTRPQVADILRTKDKSVEPIDLNDKEAVKKQLTKKQNIQLVLKKKWSELQSANPEDFHKSMTDFVNRVMDYRRKGLIKGDKAYTEKGSATGFNGMSHWIDSIEGLVANRMGVSNGEAARIVHEAQSDWALNIDKNERDGKLYNQRLKELGIADEPGNNTDNTTDRQVTSTDTKSVEATQSEPTAEPVEEHGTAPESTPEGVEDTEQVEEPETATHQVEAEKETEPEEKDNYYKAEEDTALPDAPEDKEIKDDGDKGLVKVDEDDNGKGIYIRSSDVEAYNKTLELIDKKEKRIQEAKEQGDKAAQQIQEGMLKNQQAKLKQIIEDAKKPSKQLVQNDIADNKTIVKNLQVQKRNIELSPMVDKLERIANGLSEKGSENLKKSRSSANSGVGKGTAEWMLGSSQKIAAWVIKAGIKSIKTTARLRMYVQDLIKRNELTKEEIKALDSMTEVQQHNLIKLINSHLDMHFGGEAGVAKKAAEFLNNNKAAAKKLANDTHGMSRWDMFKRKFTDRSAKLTTGAIKNGNKLVNEMSPISETYGERAVRLFHAMSGSGNKASEMYERAYKEIIGNPLLGGEHFLKENEQKVLSLIINLKRISELDRIRMQRNPEKPMMLHPNGYSGIEAENALKLLSENHPEMKKEFGDYNFEDLNKRADKYFGVMQKLLDMRYEAGLISDASYATMKDAKYYSPRKFLQYINNDVDFKTKIVQANNGIKKLADGSDEEYVDNPAYLMKDAIELVHRDIDKNNAFKAMNDMLTSIDTGMGRPAKYSGDFIAKLKKHYEEKDAKTPAATLTGVQNAIDPDLGWKYIKPTFEEPGENETLFKFYDKGVQKAFIMNKPYAEELEGFQQGWDRRKVALYSGGRLKQALATGVNTYFALSNTVRDAGFVIFTTNHYSPIFPVAAAQYAKDYVSHFKDAFTKGKSYQDFIKENGGRELSLGDPKLFAGEESKTKHALNEIWYQLGHRLPQTSEFAGRLAVRNRVIKNLTDEYKKSGKEITPDVQKEIQERASFQAAQTMDFAQGGTLAKDINAAIPFFNAGILGTRNLLRYAKNNPTTFTHKLLQLAAVNGALAAWNYGLYTNDKARKDMADYYQRYVTANDKSVNHIIMLPFAYTDDQGIKRYPYIKIPKPQELKLFSGLFESMALKSEGINDNYLQERGLMDAASLASYIPDGGNFLPPVLAGPVSYLSNYDFFRNRDYSKVKDKVLPQYEFNDKTPETYKKLGELLHLSPDRLKGGFEAAIPTNNQIFDLVNFSADKMGLGSRDYDRTKAAGKSWLDQLATVSNGLSDDDKNDMHKFISETLHAIPGAKRLMGVTASAPIDANSTNIVQEVNSRKYLMDYEMDGLIKEYQNNRNNETKITEDDLMKKAQELGSDPKFGGDGAQDVVNLAHRAKLAIKGIDATQIAKDIRVKSGNPEAQAALAIESMSRIPNPEDKAIFLQQLQDSNLFTKQFWAELEKLQKAQ